jgi:hypothetical protein
MAELSPTAQQVFWEFNRAASGKPDDWHYLPAIAAALRAAADQVASRIPDDCTADVFNRQLKIRAELLAIAAELEANHD